MKSKANDSLKDFFICHASEDKQEYIIPICRELENKGIKCWLDNGMIDFGDNILQKVQTGIKDSKYALIVLTENWLSKDWPLFELSNLLCREIRTKKAMIIPLFIGDKDKILDKLPLIESKYSLIHKTIDETANQLSNFIIRQKNGEYDEIINIKNICFISSEYPPAVIGGLGVHVTELTSALSNNNMKVTLILPSTETDYDYDNVCENLNVLSLANIRASYNKPATWLNFALFAADKIGELEIRPDIIHCHDWVTVLAGIICKYRYNIPLVFHLHLPNRRPFCSSIENIGLICSDLVTVNSEYVRTEVISRQLNINRIRVIKNGVNTEIFKPIESYSNDEYILFVGRLVQQKGVDILLRAFWYVTKQFPEIKLKIVGEGDLEDSLKRLSVNLMITDKVSFEGLKKGEELVEYYQKCIFVVVPSIYEPFGMTAIEALACKKPVIATNYMGLKETIQDGVTGYLFTKEDYLDLAQWMMSLINDKDKRLQMGKKGYDFILKNGYNWNEIAKDFIKEYCVLCNSEKYRCNYEEVKAFKDQIIRLAKEVPQDLPQKSDLLFKKIFEIFN